MMALSNVRKLSSWKVEIGELIFLEEKEKGKGLCDLRGKRRTFLLGL